MRLKKTGQTPGKILNVSQGRITDSELIKG